MTIQVQLYAHCMDNKTKKYEITEKQYNQINVDLTKKFLIKLFFLLLKPGKPEPKQITSVNL